MTNRIDLTGCKPEPLMSYLKALGILRLVSVKDINASGRWINGAFEIETRLSREALLKFFLNEYRPTPIVVPWSGNDFFALSSLPINPQFGKTPAGANIISAFAATQDERLSPYRQAILVSKEALESAGIRNKDQMKGKTKSLFLAKLRDLADENLVAWIDAAAVIETEKPSFTAMLGSGGGSDGNTHFSDNFMQNLWDALPEFDVQRRRKKKDKSENSSATVSMEWLHNSLFGEFTSHQIEDRTSSLFDGGAVGGPNAGQGFERSAFANPWNFILTLEGTVCFAGSLSRRIGSHQRATSAFPFQVQASNVGSTSLSDKEQTGREIWLPLWDRHAKLNEILQVLAEGRMSTGRRQAIDGAEAMRALAGLGVDKGITGFQRFAILRGRVGGENYNTAVSLGPLPVKSRPQATLFYEIDPWLGSFRAACGDNTPARFTSALRAIERAIFDFCHYGGTSFFQAVLVALGQAEAVIAGSPGFREKAKVKLSPLANLSQGWVAASRDDSPEFEIALALASIHEARGRLGPLRTNLEPVVFEKNHWGWTEKNRAVVWNASDLATNLAAIMGRRLVDGQRAGSYQEDSSRKEFGPLTSFHPASLSTVTAFLANEVDDQRISDLLWGLVLCKVHEFPGVTNPDDERFPSRAYALLKLLFLSSKIGDVLVSPDPALLAILRPGRVEEAGQIACRILRAKGFMPMPYRKNTDSPDLGFVTVDAHRLAAALLLPISETSAFKIKNLVLRPKETTHN